MADLRSLKETAAFFDVSEPTLRRWIETPGFPVAEKGSSGNAYKLDLHAVAAWRRDRDAAETAEYAARTARDTQLRLELLGPDAVSLSGENATLTAKQRADALQAELAQIRLEQTRGALVRADDVKLGLTEALATLKTSLRQIPDTAAPDLALAPHQVDRLGAIIDAALNDAAAALDRVAA